MQTIHRGILIILLSIAILGAASGPSTAQNTIRLEQLLVDLRPEYDQPSVLVIYQGALAPDTPLPATLTLRLPARVRQPYAVAYADGSGNLMNAPYTTQVEGDWLAITLETPATNFHLEFYDELERVDQQRSYTFVWPGDYAVGQFNLVLLPPPGAAELQTTPELSYFESSDGSHRGAFDSLNVGQELRLTLSYDGSSVSSSPAAPSGEAPSNETDGNPSDQAHGKLSPLAVGVVLAVSLAIILAVVWYSRRSQRQPAPEPPQPRRPKRSRSQRRELPQTSPAGHCTQCGQALRSSDRFCGSCGAPVEK